jgi:hypothetical protein
MTIAKDQDIEEKLLTMIVISLAMEQARFQLKENLF